MAFPVTLINAVSQISPMLGSALLGPLGGIVGTLISNKLGVDMQNTESFVNAVKNDPAAESKLKELELQLNDLKNARESADKEQGFHKLTRLILAILAHLAVVADIYAINRVESDMAENVLIIMLVILIWDIRQIYRFYFGFMSEPDFSFFFKKK